MPKPGSFAAKVAALAILATVLLTANLLAMQPLYEAYRKNNADIAASRELLRRYQALAAEKPGLIERLTSPPSEISSRSIYLEGENHALPPPISRTWALMRSTERDGDVESLRSQLPAEGESHRNCGKLGSSSISRPISIILPRSSATLKRSSLVRRSSNSTSWMRTRAEGEAKRALHPRSMSKCKSWRRS